MSLLTLSFTLGFVLIALGLSTWLKLGIQKDVVIATIRSAIQLLVVGFILKFVFGSHRVIFTLLMIVLMIAVATQNAGTRGKGIHGVVWKILASITLVEIVTQALMLGLHIIPFEPKYVIPISGMIVGNSMIVASLFLNRLQAESKSRRQEILVVLGLGGTPKQAIFDIVKRAIRASMIPTIDSTKTTGLVQLPGMMTGQIIAGADPIQAVRYQLLILFTIMASAAMTSICLAFLTYPSLFNRHQQFILRSE